MTDWPMEPAVWLLAAAAAGGYALAWRRVNGRHPSSPISAWRLAAWLAGLVAIVAALASPLDVLAEDLLTAHMIQHVLLAMVVPPLLALAAPVLLVLRLSSPGVRSGLVLPVLHSWPVRVVASAAVAWLAFSAVMWLTHFTPIYEAALENETLHRLEHGAFLVAGCLFWWPVVGADPMPGRLRVAPRLGYLLAQMPVNAAVGLVIYFAPSLLYQHYAVTAPLRGIDPMVDQQIGGLVMWVAGDLILLAALALVVVAWMQADARRSQRRQAPGHSSGQP